jgi:CheY-specific phosphatase CheX
MTEVMGKMREMLTTSIFEVFEKMFFIFLEPVEKRNIVFDMATEIKFKGPVEGTMKMYLTRGLVSTMVQNMLNLSEEELSDSLKEDCSQEAINMVCGNLLRNYDNSHVFNLSIPTCQNNSSGITMMDYTESQGELWQAVFDSEGETLGVLLQMQSS